MMCWKSRTLQTSVSATNLNDGSSKRVNKDAAVTDGEGSIDEDEKDETDTIAIVLAGRSAKSRMCCAMQSLQKGADVEEWSQRPNLRCLDGRERTPLKLKAMKQDSALLNKMETH